jgi:hypothetical protein
MLVIDPEITPPRISSTRFTKENHANGIPYPFYLNRGEPFVKELLKGWTVIGYTENDVLSPDIRRNDEVGGQYIAIMFNDPDGFDQWFHFGNYAYKFIES